ncbi:SGNH/GDSL hydrolase family protein [Geminisphaera colitermitum]|uniref:SGNH/GDSL hydrolase family protein n=1 Tax=Geminisphaera colitermitum TaxID=1148786 RepID=UPI000158D3C2|nr:SGNH/GDSL hydrolase family protein [Geminisphaera colitermitum]
MTTSSRFIALRAAFLAALLITTPAVVPAQTAAPASAKATDAFVLRELVECTPRDGLPHFFNKLAGGNAGKPVKIGYLGGSITAQKGWRVQSLAWLQKQFPNAKLSEINAAIGGTGSNLGVFRVEADVLDQKPDLLFVEFAVNDAGAKPADIRKAMEGIVRKTWRILPDCDIAFVYTLTASDIGGAKAGKMKRSESVMEEIADHYGIPSIHFGVEIAQLEKDGKLVMKSPDAYVARPSGDELNESADLPTDAQGRILFSKDGVHPYLDTGHALYTQAIIRSVPAIRAAGDVTVARNGAATTPRTLPAPLVADNWEAARMIPFGSTPALRTAGPAVALDAKTDGVARSFANRLPHLWKLEPGATLSFKFRGTKAAVYDLVGPDSDAVEIILDGVKREARRFDGYCTYRRLSTLSIGDNLVADPGAGAADPGRVHEVTVRVLADRVDKKNVLFERNRADFDSTPEKYAGSNWYAGAVFLVGELVE